MTCAAAIALVLAQAGRPLRAAAIAEEINRQGLYVRRDGVPLPAYQVASIAHGSSARFRITDGLIALAEWAEGDMPSSEAAAPVAVLIGCVSRKESTARPAKDLYRTELFRRRRAHAEASGLPWFIVSALHGLLDPDESVEPYDVALTDLDGPERHALAARVATALEDRVGSLAGRTLEVHAGNEYFRMLGLGLRPLGATLFNPVRGLRIGEQLAWYGGPSSGRSDSARPLLAVQAAVPAPVEEAVLRTRGLARAITGAFMAGELDLSARADAPTPGWEGMPERIVVDRMSEAGASEADLRLLLTFAAAMDRARDADRLWFAAENLWLDTPWAFHPEEVVQRGLVELGDALRAHGVTQRHGADAAAWRTIAEGLAVPDLAPRVHRAVVDGVGDARELLADVQATSAGGSPMFPMLRGPKIGPMWVRMLAYPGLARISSLDSLPVAVDVQIRKVTEFLQATDTGPLELDESRPIIQAAWASDVAAEGAVGPGPLNGTAAALDPALWFYAKWGCTRCERARKKLPIAKPCGGCRFPARDSTP